MTNSITYFLFKLKLVQPSESAIHFWITQKDADKLEYVLTPSNYKTRKLAAEALEQIAKPCSFPALLKCINDKEQNASVACLSALKHIFPSNKLIKSVVKKRKKRAKIEANKDVKIDDLSLGTRE